MVLDDLFLIRIQNVDLQTCLNVVNSLSKSFIIRSVREYDIENIIIRKRKGGYS